MADVLVLQHAPCEGLGSIREPLDDAGLHVQHVRVFAGDEVPADPGTARALVVMGGPMSVYEQDRYPFLRNELRLIQSFVTAAKPVLGVCLGSQLLAAALGGEVTKGKQPEVGWHPVRLTDDAAGDPAFAGIPAEFMAFHWHGDVFSLPPGATALASSAITQHQAFRYGGNAYGLLFHLEMTRETIHGMVENFGEDLAGAGVSVAQLNAGTQSHLPLLQSLGARVFKHWTSLAAGVR